MTKPRTAVELVANVYQKLFSIWVFDDRSSPETLSEDISAIFRIGDPFALPRKSFALQDGFRQLKEFVERHFSRKEKAAFIQAVNGFLVSFRDDRSADAMKNRRAIRQSASTSLIVQSESLEHLPHGHKAELNRFLRAIDRSVFLDPVEVYLCGPMARARYVPARYVNVAVISDVFGEDTWHLRVATLRKLDPNPLFLVFPIGLTSQEFSSCIPRFSFSTWNSTLRVAWRGYTDPPQLEEQRPPEEPPSEESGGEAFRLNEDGKIVDRYGRVIFSG